MRLNTDAGIRSFGSVISDNTVSDSGGDGIEGSGSIIRNNYVSGSGSDGISGGASIVSGNKVSSNSGYGIRVGGGSIVSDNIVRFNGASGIYNDFPESEGENPVDFGTIIRGNNVQSNTGYGLELSYVTTYRDNMITGNTVGPVEKGTNLGGNHCTGTGTIAFTCP